ncbi:MAG: hypothetical protein KatS3mg084_0517 [Candidatus Dojkabacteria bacterium]|nr:MAG: hypothetical protein KatS3mg084_0517 [Candidatus Dojkabacteria bacterium]
MDPEFSSDPSNSSMYDKLVVGGLNAAMVALVT